MQSDIDRCAVVCWACNWLLLNAREFYGGVEESNRDINPRGCGGERIYNYDKSEGIQGSYSQLGSTL